MSTPPPKNFIKIWKNLVDKKIPRESADRPGGEGGEPQGEAMMNKVLHQCRKGVYTPANEEATEKDSYAC
jgi:hypothetical protein